MWDFFKDLRHQLGCVALLVSGWLMGKWFEIGQEYPVDLGGKAAQAIVFAMAFPMALLAAYLILWQPQNTELIPKTRIHRKSHHD
jgi:hypothetical protein